MPLTTYPAGTGGWSQWSGTETCPDPVFSPRQLSHGAPSGTQSLHTGETVAVVHDPSNGQNVFSGVSESLRLGEGVLVCRYVIGDRELRELGVEGHGRGGLRELTGTQNLPLGL